MLNLFDRVYMRHDNVLIRGQGQRKLIITPKTKDAAYIESKSAQIEIGLIGVYEKLAECEAFYGNRDTMWAVLRQTKSKVIIIADKWTFAELIIQYWKSIFKSPTAESLFSLYEVMINNENLHTIRPMEKRVNQYSADSPDEAVVKLTKDAFKEVFDRVEGSPVLETLELKELPFEYALMAYLVDETNPTARKVLFPKVDKIVKDNIVAQLIGSRDEMLYESHNYYLIDGKENEVPITDPIAYMKNHPALSWVLDDVFQYGQEEEILAKYGLEKIKLFIRVVGRILFENDLMLVAIDFIRNKQYAELIEHDIGDHRGNYFGTHAYQRKINSLFVSYMYQLKRLNLVDQLAQYQLR